MFPFRDIKCIQLKSQSLSDELVVNLMCMASISRARGLRLCTIANTDYSKPFLFLFQGYLPPAADRRQATLERKRKEYFSFIDQYYDTRHQEMHEETFRQVCYLSCKKILYSGKQKTRNNKQSGREAYVSETIKGEFGNNHYSAVYAVSFEAWTQA